jgi:hypothetical protein
VKVETDEAKAWAGVWVREDTKDGKMVLNMVGRPIQKKDWQSYTVEGTID